MGKTDYAFIRYNHCALTANATLVEIPLQGGQNDHLGLVMIGTQYTLVGPVIFFHPTDPGQMPIIWAWTPHFDEKKLLREHKKHRLQYDK